LSLKGQEMIIDVLDDLTANKINRTPQEQEKVTFAYTLKRNDEFLDFNQTSVQVINRVRGLSPEPGAHAYIGNQIIKFYSVSNSDIIRSEAKPGTVLENKKKLIIATQDGAVEIIEIQVPGKRQMAVKDFLNGQTMINIGDVFKEGNE